MSSDWLWDDKLGWSRTYKASESPPPVVQRPPDPDDLMTGECLSCHSVVEIVRWQAAPPRPAGIQEGGGQLHHECYMAGCPQCGARIYLRRKQ